jgi:hypothetical protein
MTGASAEGLALLSAMITPAVLISACGTLILSTSTRLARIVDRVRNLSGDLESLFTDTSAAAELRRSEVHAQLALHTRRGRIVQRALTSFYVSLGVFVGTTIAIGLVAFLPGLGWAPAALGILGAVILFYGCALLINETRLALRSVDMEMEFVLRLQELYRTKG